MQRWSGQWESNPHEQLGKLPGYHYIMPAVALAFYAMGSVAVTCLRTPAYGS